MPLWRQKLWGWRVKWHIVSTYGAGGSMGIGKRRRSGFYRPWPVIFCDLMDVNGVDILSVSLHMTMLGSETRQHVLHQCAGHVDTHIRCL